MARLKHLTSGYPKVTTSIHMAMVQKLAEALGRVATFNFKGLAATWWAGLPQGEREVKTQEWPVLQDYM
jgi:hypothetical protein